MKQVPQNEMDLLLRKWSQPDQTGATEVHSAHLDPDELSAYAENALPAVARAKYTEHLVDCTTCRRIVSELAPSLVRISKTEEAAPSAFRHFFSKLTTPSFLRYAVPSLAAVLILAMGFLVVNRQRSETHQQMVAKNEAQPSSLAQLPEPTPSRGVVATTDSQARTAGEKGTAKTTTTAARPESTPVPADVTETRIQAESEKRAEANRRDVARQAPAPPAPAPAAASTGASNERELAKSTVTPEKKQEPAAEVRQMKEEARKLDDIGAVANAPKAKAPPPPSRARMRGASGMPAEAVGRDNQKKDSNQEKDRGETRTVSGRNFRKVNGVWTDTAYDGRDTTNLSRGSEQFRALVADEPSLRTIAEQLDGQIVVLWKGRAYRIR